MNPDLQNYINQSCQQGLTGNQIKNNLLANRWSEATIREAFGLQLSGTLPNQNPMLQGPKQSKTLWTFVIIFGILYGIFWGLARVFGQIGEPIVNIIIFAVRIFFPVLGLIILALTKHFQKQTSSLPIELFYWCGVGSLLYYSINIFYQGGLSFYLIISLGIAFLTTLIFWLSTRPFNKKRTIIFTLIIFALLGWYTTQTYILPAIQTRAKPQWTFVDNPNLNLLESEPYVSSRGFQLRIPKDWRIDTRGRDYFLSPKNKPVGGFAVASFEVRGKGKVSSYVNLSAPDTRIVTFKTISGLDVKLAAGKEIAGTLGQVGFVAAEIYAGSDEYLVVSGSIDPKYIDQITELIGTSLKTFEVTK